MWPCSRPKGLSPESTRFSAEYLIGSFCNRQRANEIFHNLSSCNTRRINKLVPGAIWHKWQLVQIYSMWLIPMQGIKKVKTSQANKQSNFARAHILFGTFSCFPGRTKFPYATFCWARKTSRRIFISLNINLGAVPKNSTPRKFPYIWHFKRVGIHFHEDLFAKFVVVVFAKSP